VARKQVEALTCVDCGARKSRRDGECGTGSPVAFVQAMQGRVALGIRGGDTTLISELAERGAAVVDRELQRVFLGAGFGKPPLLRCVHLIWMPQVMALQAWM